MPVEISLSKRMGNSNDEKYIDELGRAFSENEDSRVKGMAAWALGKIGGHRAKSLLGSFLTKEDNTEVRGELEYALEMCGRTPQSTPVIGRRSIPNFSIREAVFQGEEVAPLRYVP